MSRFSGHTGIFLIIKMAIIIDGSSIRRSDDLEQQYSADRYAQISVHTALGRSCLFN